ncbi:phospholipase [Anaeromicrobium sediminis]|uniref:phospholipase D n=2 Tax=Anaeromicrobium sediminis TaxID=1478221 RepID=A0A267MDV8_9FIRM|nr:phospholipase [Anaeromicrobium sediminis]
MNGFFRSVPDGVSYKSEEKDGNIEFLYDITYMKGKEYIKEQKIFNEQLKLIDEAEDFILVDMFLFNDDYNRNTKVKYPEISKTLTEALINKKKENPHVKILFITDEINNFYGVYESEYIKELKANNIPVIITNMEKMRDSNPMYSGVWRSFIKWSGVGHKGLLPNPFRADSSKVTLRGYLKLLNFKANHRKVIITDRGAIVASMNPHDASGNHSNMAFKVTGPIIEDLIKSELNVLKLSGLEEDISIEYKGDNMAPNGKVTLITEGKIKESLIKEIKEAKKGDEIKIAMFYLSEREVIKELINASRRGVNVRIILDCNKDAFGVKKNGIPNRQVALELKNKSENNIEIKWYDTHGEQFHTKLIVIKKKKETIIIGGSANLTRRNIGDYNLETDLMVRVNKDDGIERIILNYFDRIWNNDDGLYTVDYSEYEDESIFRTMIYRFQEWSGFSTF